jgi:hypothetical protein
VPWGTNLDEQWALLQSRIEVPRSARVNPRDHRIELGDDEAEDPFPYVDLPLVCVSLATLASMRLKQAIQFLARNALGGTWIPWAEGMSAQHGTNPPPYTAMMWYATVVRVKQKLWDLLSGGPSPMLAWYIKSNLDDPMVHGIHPMVHGKRV